MGKVGAVPAAASAAPTAGSNGATTTCGDNRRGAVSTPADEPMAGSWAEKSAAAIATVPLSPLSRLTALLVNGPSGSTVAPRVDAMSRIWSTTSPALLVAAALNPGSWTRCRASRSASA